MSTRPNHAALLGATIFLHACKLGLEGIVSKRLGSRYRSGRSPDWLKMKKPACAAVKREAEEDWSAGRTGARSTWQRQLGQRANS
jgi:ATP-dependent DNA ligase